MGKQTKNAHLWEISFVLKCMFDSQTLWMAFFDVKENASLSNIHIIDQCGFFND